MTGTSIATSLDGQWAIVRRGREVSLLERGAAPVVGQLELDSDDVELAFVGPPTVLCAVVRAPEPKVVLYQLPYLDAAARLDLAQPMRLAAITGPRMVLLSADAKQVALVRTAGSGLAQAPLEVGGAVEFAVGLERNQVLFGLPRKLEVWDAVASRPLLRLQLQLPPPPRTVGPAQGHLWVVRPGSDEVFIYRLSDGRPFRHYVGEPVEAVISHPASPMLVLVTARGLVRLHCFAHSLTVIDSPWAADTALAQLAAGGDDVSLLGIGVGDTAAEPWRVAIGGAGAPLPSNDPATAIEPAERLRSMRERAAAAGGEFVADAQAQAQAPRPPPTASIYEPPAPVGVRNRAWRTPLATFAIELVRGAEAEIPVVAVDNELGDLAHRLGLPGGARRAMIVLYALHLIGKPAIPIARLAGLLDGEWAEPLGQGELHALGMLRRKDGKVALRQQVTDLLDGAGPRAIRLLGGAATSPRSGVSRVAREGRSDAAIETDLARQLGRIGVIEGAPALALLEARLHGATAVALAAPAARPQLVPRDAGLVVVADAGATDWVSALPALT